MQSQPTDWRPLPLPQYPSRIVSVGTCPYFEYEGSGVVMLDVARDKAILRIHPDVERLQHALRGTLAQPLTRLREATHPFRLRLSNWTGARVERLDLDGETWLPIQGSAAEFSANAGVYRLVR